MTESQTRSKTVKISYYAGVFDLVKVRMERLPIPDNLAVKDFMNYLARTKAELGSEAGQQILRTCALAINLEYVDRNSDDTILEDGDDIVLIPPVSGG